jgi:hypothetical protein
VNLVCEKEKEKEEKNLISLGLIVIPNVHYIPR